MEKDFQEIEVILQTVLNDGWKVFKEGKKFASYSKLWKMLKPFYESELREVIPFPAYQLGAQEIGSKFIEESRKLGLSYNEIFPGNFDSSSEMEGDRYDVRTFVLTTYLNGEFWGRLILSFPHSHDSFDFPAPPTVEMRKGNEV